MSTPSTAPRAPARTPPGGPSGPQRSRPIQIAVVAVSVVLLGVAALIYFVQSGGDDDEDKARPSRKSVSGNVQLVLGGIQNANAGAPATLPDDAANQIMQAVGTYVDGGLVAPVKTGKPPTDLSALFDAGTQAALQGPDKDVLFENGQPERTGDFLPAAQPVTITALSDGTGQFVLATAGFAYTSEVGVTGGTLKTARNIALTFISEGGQWKITGYDVLVLREGAEVEVPTAAAQR
jgi:hypothetical protein